MGLTKEVCAFMCFFFQLLKVIFDVAQKTAFIACLDEVGERYFKIFRSRKATKKNTHKLAGNKAQTTWQQLAVDLAVTFL